MLFLSVTRPDQMQLALNIADAIELRLDLFPIIDFHLLRSFIYQSTHPVMLTLRKASQGGRFQGSEVERETLIERLLALEPPFFDLEWDMRPEFIEGVLNKYSKTKFVLSVHNFEAIPADLEEVYQSMCRYEAFSYKIAVMVHSTNEALKMLLFAKTHPKASVICMGECGAFARVLGPVFGNLIDYASLDFESRTAPGQLTAHELIDVYHYASLNSQTAIYGLIGDPVEKSPGHLYHNEVFRKRGLNAVYIKMRLKPEELAEFMLLAKEIGMKGLSITIPLKERVSPFVEAPAERIGAINTIAFKEGRVVGINTDGLGALDAIGNVRGKKVVLLGAGGAARAIAFEAKARGANVLILNRTVQRGKELARELECEAGGLDEVPEEYDVLVNCSAGPMPIDPKRIRAETVAMDVIYSPRETDFLKEAARKRCQIVYGEEMFLKQAAKQTAFWVGSC